jgi:hypothetical protein
MQLPLCSVCSAPIVDYHVFTDRIAPIRGFGPWRTPPEDPKYWMSLYRAS